VAHAGREAAATLGPIGVWANLDRARAAEVRAFAREVEALAFGALWYPETLDGKEALSLATLLLDATERLVIATGIASIWARDAMAAANGARAIADAFPGRFVLGLGVSHAPSASARGHRYDRPYESMVAYLDAVDATRYVGPAPAPPAPRVLAALGPRMLRLAAERAAGAHPYFVPVAHTAVARDVLGAGPVLAVEQGAVLETDARRAREIARAAYTRRYLGLENYLASLRRLGFADADLQPDGGSDALVDAVVAHGDAAAIAARVNEHRARGADHVCVQVFRSAAGLPVPELRALAKALA